MSKICFFLQNEDKELPNRGNLAFAFRTPDEYSCAMGLTAYLAGFALLVFAGMSFFFALAESALFSLGQWQVRQLAERAPVAGRMVARLLAEPQHLLATIVLGNTVANACIVAICAVGAPWRALGAVDCCCRRCSCCCWWAARFSQDAGGARAGTWALRVGGPMFFLQNFTRAVPSRGATD